ARRFVVSSHSRRFHLDGPLVPPVVWSDRKKSRQISHLQELEPASVGRRTRMKIEDDRHRLISEIEALASISDAEAPAVTRIVFTLTNLKARAWLKTRFEKAAVAA